MRRCRKHLPRVVSEAEESEEYVNPFYAYYCEQLIRGATQFLKGEDNGTLHGA